MPPPTNDRHRASGRPACVRPTPVAGAALALLLAIVGAVVAVASTPASAQAVPAYGIGPYESVRQAGTEHAKCAGLTSPELIAMMMVPTWGEAGTPVPPPMALGRWDNLSVSANNARLFAFGQTSGPYVNAYFNAGVGLWQFDSAGGWNLTAADAIDTLTAARQAASTMAFRYCNAPSSVARDDASLRRYAWGPWFACASGSTCEDLYNRLYRDGQVVATLDGSVSRFGGMEQRTCDIAGIGTGVTCWYVDPARAQGSTGWRAGTYDPNRTNYVTPLPKPFYVVRAGDREHRYWIQADTGYDIGITAHKRVVGNARSAGELVWEGAAPLCDRTAGRGSCGGTSGPRVASTPWGPRSQNPIGVFDTVTPHGDGRARVTGWAIDPDTSDPVDVHLYVDGQGAGAVRADASRPDVGAAIPGYGNGHGFDTTISVGAGTHEVCAFAINVGPYGDANAVLGCRSVTVDGNPKGNLEAVTAGTGGVRVQGWALDPDTVGPVEVHVYLDGAWAGTHAARSPRADVGAIYPRLGADHGFDIAFQTTGGTHQVCAFAINAGPNGNANAFLGCGSATVSSDPFGSLESIGAGPGAVSVSGWALDPDTGDAAVQVSVDGVAVGTLPTGLVRADVAAVFPGRGTAHGYAGSFTVAPGDHQVCATVLNQGPGASRPLGCRSVRVAGGDPSGNYEAAVRTGEGVRVSGWAIDPDSADPVTLHVYVNGAFSASAVADAHRADVGAVFPGYGPAHGFDATVGAPPGATVCVFAINIGPGTTNPLMGCRVA
jgi:hypothetical protein